MYRTRVKKANVILEQMGTEMRLAVEFDVNTGENKLYRKSKGNIDVLLVSEDINAGHSNFASALVAADSREFLDYSASDFRRLHFSSRS